jgi:hypothetical protein
MTTNVAVRQRRRQRYVDEGSVDDDVYLVEAILEDGEAYRYRNSGEAQDHHEQ